MDAAYMNGKERSTFKRFLWFLLLSAAAGTSGALIGFAIPENHPDDQLQNATILGMSSFSISMLICYISSFIRRRILSPWDAALVFLLPLLAVFTFWCFKGGHQPLGTFATWMSVAITIYLVTKLARKIVSKKASALG